MDNAKCLPEDRLPHVDTHICGKCRKPFEPGARVLNAYIFHSVGVNPLNLGNKGVLLHEDFELVHVDCRDPLLKKGLQ